jgi:hypothetical protein
MRTQRTEALHCCVIVIAGLAFAVFVGGGALMLIAWLCRSLS